MHCTTYAHNAEALVNPKGRAIFLLILDTPEHVDSEKIKLKIGSVPGPCFINFFLNVI
jgi:hypothetical protein